MALADSVATAHRKHEGFLLSARWNARARRQRATLGQAEAVHAADDTCDQHRALVGG